jgi:hypothetical protein
MASMLARFESSGFLRVRTSKNPVHAAPLDNEAALHHHTVDACQTIRNYPGSFERMRRSKMRRVEACTESHGGHFQHLLYKFNLSAITHR